VLAALAHAQVARPAEAARLELIPAHIAIAGSRRSALVSDGGLVVHLVAIA